MADTRVKILEIKVNMAEALDNLTKYNQVIEENKAKIKDLKSQFKEGKISQESFAKGTTAAKEAMKTARKSASDLSQAMQAQIKSTNSTKGSINQLKSELTIATKKYNEMSQAERNSANGMALKQHIVQLKTELNSATTSADQLYKKLANSGAARSGLAGLGTSIKGMLTQLAFMATGGGLVMFGKKVTEVTRNFEDGMAHVRAVTNATTEDMDKMTERAKLMGLTTRYTATEAAGALENLARNGYNASDSTELLDKVLHMAQANAISLAESADTLSFNIKRFGLSTEDATYVSDVLSKTCASSATNITLLEGAMKNAGTTAHLAGVGIEETCAALGVLANSGLRGEEAGTKLRMTFAKLVAPSGKAAKVLEKYGLNINQATIESEGLVETMNKLRKSGIQKNSADLATLFGQRTYQGAALLIENLESMQELVGKLGNSSGETARMFDQSYSEMGVSIDALKSAWESFMIKLGESASGGGIGIIDAIKNGLVFITQNFSEVGRVVMAVLGAITFKSLMASAIASFTSIKVNAITTAEQSSLAVQQSQAKEQMYREQTAVLEAQLEAKKRGEVQMTAQQEQLIVQQLEIKKRQLSQQTVTTQKLQQKELVAYTKVQALQTGSAWSRGMATAKIAVLGFVASAKAAFKGFIVTAIISLIFELIMLLYDKIKEGAITWEKFKQFAVNAWNAILKGVQDAINWVVRFINNTKAVRVAIMGIVSYFQSMWSVASGIFKLLVNAVKNVASSFSGFGTIISGIFTLDSDKIKKGWNEVTSGVKKVFNGIADDASKMGNEVYKKMKDGFDKASGNEPLIQEVSLVQEVKPAKKKSAGSTTKTSQTAATPVEPTEEESTITTTTGGIGVTKGESKAARERRKIQEDELKAVSEYQKKLVALLGQSYDARREQVNQKYDQEAAAIKLKLKQKADGTLKMTETTERALTDTLLLIEKEREFELKKLQLEDAEKEIKRREDIIKAKLDAVKKGSDEETELLISQENERYNLQHAESVKNREMELRGLAEGSDEYLEVLARYQTLDEERREAHWNRVEQIERDAQQRVRDMVLQSMENQNLQMEMFFDMAEMARESHYEDVVDAVGTGEMLVLKAQAEAAELALQQLLQRGRLETQTQQQYDAEVLKSRQDLLSKKKAINDAEIKNEKAKRDSMRALTDSLISMAEELGESSEALAKISKIIALGQIAVDTGRALAAGVAQAQSVPFPANIAAIATTVATILANTATAISTVKSAKFAKGGKVEGPGTGTSDSIPANLSNGEYIMTAKATKMFEPWLQVMNAIGAGAPIGLSGGYRDVENNDAIVGRFTNAISEIRPVVSVEEITDVQKRVRTIQNLDTV